MFVHVSDLHHMFMIIATNSPGNHERVLTTICVEQYGHVPNRVPKDWRVDGSTRNHSTRHACATARHAPHSVRVRRSVCVCVVCSYLVKGLVARGEGAEHGRDVALEPKRVADSAPDARPVLRRCRLLARQLAPQHAPQIHVQRLTLVPGGATTVRERKAKSDSGGGYQRSRLALRFSRRAATRVSLPRNRHWGTDAGAAASTTTCNEQ